MAFEFTQNILFKYCDPAGIVFYPRYFEIINDCVETFFAEALNTPFELLLRDAGIPTAQISASFTAPSRHGDIVSILLTVTRIGTSSVDLSFIAHCGEEARFSANATLVYINQSGKSQPWPAPLRVALSRFTGESHDA